MTKEQIGIAVKNKRLSLNLSQLSLAEKAKVRRQTIIDIENASLNYSIDKLIAVQNVLNLFIINTETDLFIFKKNM